MCSALQQTIKFAFRIEFMQVVAAACMEIANKNLGHGIAPMRALDHLLPCHGQARWRRSPRNPRPCASRGPWRGCNKGTIALCKSLTGGMNSTFLLRSPLGCPAPLLQGFFCRAAGTRTGEKVQLRAFRRVCLELLRPVANALALPLPLWVWLCCGCGPAPAHPLRRVPNSLRIR